MLRLEDQRRLHHHHRSRILLRNLRHHLRLLAQSPPDARSLFSSSTRPQQTQSSPARPIQVSRPPPPPPAPKCATIAVDTPPAPAASSRGPISSESKHVRAKRRKSPRSRRLPAPQAACQPHTQHRGKASPPSLAPRRAFAAVSVFCISIAIVSAPTPPGTGVYAPDTANAAGSTSPTTVEPRLANVRCPTASPGKNSATSAGIRHPIDPDIDQHRARLHHLGRHKPRPPNRRHQYVGIARKLRQILRLAVAHRHRRGGIQQHHRRRLAHNVRPSHHHCILCQRRRSRRLAKSP